MGDAPYYQGKVLCYLDEEELLSPFQSIRYDQGGMLCILDAAGELVMQDNPGGLDFSELDQSRCTGSQGSFLQSIGGETMLVSYLHSGEYGWTYLSVIPQSVILAPSSGARLFLFVMIIVSLAAGCLLFCCQNGKTGDFHHESSHAQQPARLPKRAAGRHRASS